MMEDKQYIKKLGLEIAKIRKEKKISHQELAFRSDLEKSSVIRIEKGTFSPKVATLIRLSKGLGVHISKFFAFLPKDYYKE